MVALTRGAPCRVYFAFHTNLHRQFARSATPAMIRAAAANAYVQGAEGFARAVALSVVALNVHRIGLLLRRRERQRTQRPRVA